ncbi:DeoR family transcriptional regulator [Phascolarctobacterium faecium]|jgi:DeoR/GlpR family transcriptional regulator of sugar metabolism|uniref:DeoR family transcriptional regulator n=1 Tax=Phascolarctobacterium faecium TaxID=33025 RepID=UPI0032C19A92
MQSALDRRQSILEAISDRRFETLENLAAEFGVSKATIRRDIEILGCSAPIDGEYKTYPDQQDRIRHSRRIDYAVS